MNNINIEARFLALKTELTLNTTGRRRKIIIDELNKLATSINEIYKMWVENTTHLPTNNT